MSLLDQLFGALSGQSGASDTASHPLAAALHSLLTQNGGVQGLMNKFSQGGMGEVFSSWVGLGENKAITSEQVLNLLGSEQVTALASSLGLDPAQASGFLADYLPKIVDKLTPSGQLEEASDSSGGLAALMPALLSSFTGGDSGRA